MKPSSFSWKVSRTNSPKVASSHNNILNNRCSSFLIPAVRFGIVLGITRMLKRPNRKLLLLVRVSYYFISMNGFFFRMKHNFTFQNSMWSFRQKYKVVSLHSKLHDSFPLKIHGCLYPSKILWPCFFFFRLQVSACGMQRRTRPKD